MLANDSYSVIIRCMVLNGELGAQEQGFVQGRRVGLGIMAADILVGFLDATNRTFIGGLDIAPSYYVPAALMGATLAISATFGQRHIKSK